MFTRLFLYGLISLSLSSFASAQTWQSIQPSGPDSKVGGLVNELSFADSGEAYLLSSLGYVNHRSASDQPWSRIPVTLDGVSYQLSGLHVGSGDPAVLLGRIGFSRLIKSEDGGVTWTELELPELGTGSFSWVFGFASAPSNPDTLYYSLRDKIVASTDAGSSWSVQTSSIPGFIFSFRIHPLSASTLIAQASGDFVISTDAGVTWSEQSNGIPDNRDVYAVELDPTNLNTYYAAIQNKLYKSTDSAQNWSLVLDTNNNNTGFNELTVGANDPSIIYAAQGFSGDGSIYRSINGGITWTENANSSDETSYYRRVDASVDGSVIAGGGQGVVSSLDGINYQLSNSGFNDFYAVSMAVSPSDNDVMYVCGQNGGVIVTQDGGQNWERRNTGLEFGFARSCAVDNSDPMLAYYASNDGLYKTTNGGLLWSRVQIEASIFETVYTIVVAPTDSSRLYARKSTGVFTSADGGSSWSQVLDNSYFVVFGPLYPLVVSPSDSSTVYIGTYDSGLLKSIDAGVTWEVLDDLLPSLFVNSIGLDPNDPERFVIGLDDNNVLETEDSGLSWKDRTYQLPGSFRATAATTIDPNNGDVYAVTSSENGQVFHLPRNSQEWVQLGSINRGDGDYAQQVIPSTQRRGRLFLQAQELYSLDFDTDSDGIIDSEDNCVNQANSDQYDSNSDGFGNLCDPDFDNNSTVSFLDVAIFRAAFLSQPGNANWNPDVDMNNDGFINFVDYSFIPAYFLMPPGPSGLIL